MGRNISTPNITRKTDKGLPRYWDREESDIYILSGEEDLLPEFKKDASGSWVMQNGQHVIFDEPMPREIDGVQFQVRRYRPRIEGLFSRIERWTSLDDGTIHWRSITRDNVTSLYGKTAESCIADPTDPTHIFSWLLCESYDDKGNAILYDYKAEDSAGVDLGLGA